MLCGLELGSELIGSITHGCLGKAKSYHLRGRPVSFASQWGPCFLNNAHSCIVVSGRQEAICFLPINHYGPATSGYVHQKVTTQALLLNSQSTQTNQLTVRVQLLRLRGGKKCEENPKSCQMIKQNGLLICCLWHFGPALRQLSTLRAFSLILYGPQTKNDFFIFRGLLNK